MTSGVTDSRGLQKPLPAEIDVCGLTHRGRVRRENADHFLIASFHRAMQVHNSSIPHTAFSSLSADSRGYVFLVADGVGAFAQAADGSARAIRSVAQYLVDMSEVSLSTDPEREQEIVARVHNAVVETHQALLDMDDDGLPGSAVTTLTMCVAMWPRLFVVHVGDSRAYRLRDGELAQLTTDQTMAQAMVESGIMSRDAAERSHYRNVLLSALGSSQFEPEISVCDLDRNDAAFLCTDGLTRHVSDAEIKERLDRGGTSESICQDLLGLALARGGEDNVTVVMGQVRR
jgi:PPM family protein phosphatase